MTNNFQLQTKISNRYPDQIFLADLEMDDFDEIHKQVVNLFGYKCVSAKAKTALEQWYIM